MTPNRMLSSLVAAFLRAFRQRRGDRDSGAVIVEFVIVFPVFMVLTLAMLTGGIVMTHQLSLTQATREAARYGSTVAQDQCASSSNCAGLTWAQLVQSVAVQRAGGDVTNAGVCIALVTGPGTSPSAVDASHTTAGGTSPCYVDNSNDTGLRVQVSVSRPDQIQLMVTTLDITLSSHAIARYEPS